MGPRGDAIAQLDWSVGQVLATLDRLGLTRNTLVLFTSDNGPVIDDGYRDDAVEKLGGHTPAGPFRGGKYSTFEGGHARAVRRALAGAGEAGRLRCARLAGRSHRVVLGARRISRGHPGSRRERADSENVLPALLGTSKTGADRAGRAGGARSRSGRGSGSTSRRARVRASTRTRTRKRATTRSRSSTISPAIPESGTISPRPVRRKFASSPRCSRESVARRRSTVAPRSARSRGAQHRPRHRRRLVVPSREHLRRSNGQHAELRSHRARGRAVHPCVRRVAVVHAVTRGAPDRPGGSPAGGRRQPARVSPEDLHRLSRSPGRSRLYRRLHRQGLGSRPVRGRRAHQEPRGPAVQELR